MSNDELGYLALECAVESLHRVDVEIDAVGQIARVQCLSASNKNRLAAQCVNSTSCCIIQSQLKSRTATQWIFRKNLSNYT